MSQDDTINELLSRGVAEAIDIENLKRRLTSKDKLRIKFGIDPTSPNIHLGRAVALLKLRDFQKLGHKIIFIVGDFTGQIGDTSDKEAERPMLTANEVKQNMKSYIQQASKIIDIRQTEVVYNSRYLKKLNFMDIGNLADVFSVADFTARENVKKRLDAGKRVSLRELLYPLMQGYDSVAVRADVEIGGTDQRFNLLAGRKLQPLFNQQPQDVITLNLIMGTDGRKMSSSWGNTINLTDSPEDMFGKVMSLADDQIIPYFIHATRVPLTDIADYDKELRNGANPRDFKLKLAEAVVNTCFDSKLAIKAKNHFISVFQQRELPSNIPEITCAGRTIIDALVMSKIADSKSDARRLLAQNSIKISNQVITDPDRLVSSGEIIQKGKRFFVKIK